MSAQTIHQLLAAIAGAWGIALVAFVVIFLLGAWWALKQ